MRMLLLGATGQVGFELQRSLMLFGDILAPGRAVLDLHDAQAVAGYLEHNKPDLVVNAAAYTAVDKAEEERDAARRLNAGLPAQLAGHAARHDIPLVHYSSDYVYSGEGSRPWQENDTPAPLNVYGQTKLAGDQAIQQSGCRHLIFRTSWVYSDRGHNFVNTMLRLATERDELQVVSDQVGAPTPASLIADVTTMALYRSRCGEPLRGCYHLAPRGVTSWHGLAKEIVSQARALGVPLRASPENILPIPSDAYPTPAPRPRNSRLGLTKIEHALGVRLPKWEPLLAQVLAHRAVIFPADTGASTPVSAEESS